MYYTKQQGPTFPLCYPVGSHPSMCRERSLGKLGGRRDRISAQPAEGEEEGGRGKRRGGGGRGGGEGEEEGGGGRGGGGGGRGGGEGEEEGGRGKRRGGRGWGRATIKVII